MEQQPQVETTKAVAVKRHVLAEIAGGYLIAATIMSFVSLYTLAMTNLAGVTL